LEAIETDEHLKDLETINMHGKKYVNENKENPRKDTKHTWEIGEKYCINFTRRLGDSLPELHKRQSELPGRQDWLLGLHNS